MECERKALRAAALMLLCPNFLCKPPVFVKRHVSVPHRESV
jgi:hypothetical protein